MACCDGGAEGGRRETVGREGEFVVVVRLESVLKQCFGGVQPPGAAGELQQRTDEVCLRWVCWVGGDGWLRCRGGVGLGASWREGTRGVRGRWVWL